MRRVLALAFILLVSGGWWHGSSIVVGPDVDLNFAAGSNSGCASVAACMTTARASTSYAEDTAGNLSLFAPNVPRITSKGLLVEQASTNLLLQASSPATTWTVGVVGGITTSNNAVVSPDGTTNAGQIVESSGGTYHGLEQIITKSAAVLTYTYSAYVKSNDGGRRVWMQVDEGSNAATASFELSGIGSITNTAVVGSFRLLAVQITPSANGFYRAQFTYSTTASTSMRVLFYMQAGGFFSYGGNGTSALQMFCAQVELGTIATSCMNTTTTTVSRPADVITPIGVLQGDLSSAQGYVATSLSSLLAVNGYVLSRSATTDVFLGLRDIANVTTRQGGTILNTARIGKLPYFSSGGSVTAATSWGSGSISTVANGGLVVVNSGTYIGSFSPSIGSANGSSNFLNGYIERLRVGGTKPSDAALAALAPGTGAVTCATYFVSLAGSDSNDGCTTGAPWLTISKLNAGVYLPGDVISLRRGDVFAGCIDLGSTNWLATQSNPGTIGAYSAGAAPIVNANCTGENGTVRLNAVDGVTLQDLDLRTPTIPTPRANIMIENNSGAMRGGYIIQRNLIGGARYFESTRSGGAGSQGTDGGNIEVKGYPNPGGMQNISVLNNTICGLSGVSSADDVGRSGFGGGGGIFNETWRGNIVCNIGGGPSDVVANGVTYPPMGDGVEFNSVFGVLAEFNITHDLGNNFINCGGPAGLLTYSVTDVLWQFNEAYNVQPKAGNYATGGQCDFLGYDFDNFTTGSMAQYNYSHDNWGTGFYHFNAGGGSWDNNTHRYSVSENDSRGGAPGFGALGVFNQGGNPALYFYNMTTYNDRTYSGAPFGNYNQQASGISISTGAPFSGIVANNVVATSASIYSLCPFVSNNNSGFAPSAVFRNNRYYCLTGSGSDYRWANTGYSTLAAYQAGSGQDANTTEGNANWASTRPTGTCSWTPSLNNGPQSCPGGYHLTAGSSGVLGSGVNINSVFGINVGTRDYYGNSIVGGNGIGSGFNIGADGQAH